MIGVKTLCLFYFGDRVRKKGWEGGGAEEEEEEEEEWGEDD
jgi:hypothetical protein